MAEGNLSDVKTRFDKLAKSISNSESSISNVAESLKKMFKVLDKVSTPLANLANNYNSVSEAINQSNIALTENANVKRRAVKKTKEQVEATAKVIKLQKDQFKAITDLVGSQEQSIIQEEELIDGTKRYKDNLINLRTEITSVTEVTKDMGKGFFESASNSKAWTAASRVLSGSGLWKVQNRIRALIDVGAIWEKSRAKSSERTAKQSRAMENLSKVKKQLKEQLDAMAAAEAAGIGSESMEKIQESDTYKLMEARGLSHDQIMFNMNEELSFMQKQVDAQDKIIAGGKVSRAILSKMTDFKMMMKGQGPDSGEGAFDLGPLKEHMVELRDAFVDKIGDLRDTIMDAEKRKEGLKKVGNSLKFYAVYMGLAIMAVLLLVFMIGGIIAEVKANIEAGKGAWLTAWELVKFLFYTAFGIGKEIFGFVSDLINGNMTEALEHLSKVMDLIIQFGIATILLGLTLLGALLASLWEGLKRWVNDTDWKEKLKLFTTIAKALAIFGAYMLVRWFIGHVAGIIAGIIGAIPVAVIAIGAVIMAGLAMLISSLWPFAAGGTSHGGLAVVGEQGPEVINTKPGDKITNHTNTRKMLGKSGASNNVTVNVNGRLGASDQELKDLARKLGPLILQEINRKTSANMY